MSKNDRVQPIKLTDNDTNETYELDFSRESIKFAEARGFKFEDVADYPVSKFPDLFYYAFRMHNKNVPRDKTDKMFYSRYSENDEEHEKIKTKLMARLIELYSQAMNANTIGNDGDEKNARMTVEM